MEPLVKRDWHAVAGVPQLRQDLAPARAETLQPRQSGSPIRGLSDPLGYRYRKGR